MSWDKLNSYAKNGTPCIFVISYDLDNCVVCKLDETDSFLRYKLDDFSCANPAKIVIKSDHFESYKKAFLTAKDLLDQGEITLINLTTALELESGLTLEDIYNNSNAKYKILYKDKFVCFSPETFIKIENNQISTYPMKGTNRDQKALLANEKEKEEHRKTADQMLLEISQISKNAKIENFRYVEKVGDIYQTSSKIVGELGDNWQENLVELLQKLLPATSIAGVPRGKALSVISDIEEFDRGFYTGIFGIFDGNSLDSAVLIRFVEQKDGKLFSRAGGGITAKSELTKEFEEIILKTKIP